MLTECVRALARRRLWTVLAFLVAFGVGAAVFVTVTPTQQSTAQVLFVPSVKQPGVDGPTNPFLALSGSVAVVASILQAEVSDDQTAAKLARAGHTAKYEVTPNLNENAGPVLILTSEDRSPRMAQETMQAVIEEIQQNLRAVQESQNVRSDLMVTSVVLTSSPKPKVIRKTQIQMLVLSVGGVLVVLIALILLAERHRIRSALPKDDHSTSPPAAGGAGPSGRTPRTRRRRSLGELPREPDPAAGVQQDPAKDPKDPKDPAGSEPPGYVAARGAR